MIDPMSRATPLTSEQISHGLGIAPQELVRRAWGPEN